MGSKLPSDGFWLNVYQQEHPILCLQEYQNTDFNLDNYDYKYEKLRGGNLKYGQAIFSKYPIVNKGSIDFNSPSNNAIFSDIKISNDIFNHISFLYLSNNFSF